MAAGAGSGVGIDLGAGSGSGEPKARPGPEEPRVAVPDALAGSFPFAVASLEAEGSFGLLWMAELFWELF